MYFMDEDFEKVEWLQEEATNLDFKIDSASINEKGAFEVLCHVIGGSYARQKIAVRFWRVQATGKWSSFLKRFLCLFPELSVEYQPGIKSIRKDLDVMKALKGLIFTADSIYGEPSQTTGKSYLQLSNFRLSESFDEVKNRSKKDTIDDFPFTDFNAPDKVPF